MFINILMHDITWRGAARHMKYHKHYNLTRGAVRRTTLKIQYIIGTTYQKYEINGQKFFKFSKKHFNF